MNENYNDLVRFINLAVAKSGGKTKGNVLTEVYSISSLSILHIYSNIKKNILHIFFMD